MLDRTVTFALLREGPSDDGLVGHLRSIIVTAGAAEALGDSRPYGGSVESKLADLLAEKSPVDLVFVHRDSDHRSADRRHAEIKQASQKLQCADRCVAVVPIQETEAWLLLDEAAIRRVAGRPSGHTPLNLPPPHRVESLANPKEVLREALALASEASGRRLAQQRSRFTEHRRILLERLDIDGPVRRLSAWQRLLSNVETALKTLDARGS